MYQISYAKRKVDAECHVFQEKWTNYLLFVEVKGKPVCLVCEDALAVMEKASLERHYSSKHGKLCMSSLYSDENWSTQVGQKESEMVQALTNENISFHDILTRINKASNDSNFSLTDVWTALFVYPAVKWVKTSCLYEKMVNPYPIYAAIDRWRLENKDQHDKGIWFEITCHKSGYPGCGAFVETSKFGSFFKEGEILQRQDEMDLLYLQGLCGSALGSWVEDKKYMITYIKAALLFETCQGNRPIEEYVEDFCALAAEVDFNKSSLKDLFRWGLNEPIAFLLPEGKCSWTLVAYIDVHCGRDRGGQSITLESSPAKRTHDGFTDRVCNLLTHFAEVIASKNTVLSDTSFRSADCIKCIIHAMEKIFPLLSKWIWGTKYNFLHKYPNSENILPSDLVQDEKIYLIDAGLSNNCGYPLVLRPERQVQIILSFDFSAGDPFETVHQAAEYCKKNSIPFPDIPAVSEEEKACPSDSDCYIYRGKNTPTVMHFPLFNRVNCGG
ncbi:PA24C phospholipase, partial [Amia calva]|nr:PA24C phospholipase [Amia calva]